MVRGRRIVRVSLSGTDMPPTRRQRVTTYRKVTDIITERDDTSSNAPVRCYTRETKSKVVEITEVDSIGNEDEMLLEFQSVATRPPTPQPFDVSEEDILLELPSSLPIVDETMVVNPEPIVSQPGVEEQVSIEAENEPSVTQTEQHLQQESEQPFVESEMVQNDEPQTVDIQVQAEEQQLLNSQDTVDEPVVTEPGQQFSFSVDEPTQMDSLETIVIEVEEPSIHEPVPEFENNVSANQPVPVEEPLEAPFIQEPQVSEEIISEPSLPCPFVQEVSLQHETPPEQVSQLPVQHEWLPVVTEDAFVADVELIPSTEVPSESHTIEEHESNVADVSLHVEQMVGMGMIDGGNVTENLVTQSHVAVEPIGDGDSVSTVPISSTGIDSITGDSTLTEQGTDSDETVAVPKPLRQVAEKRPKGAIKSVPKKANAKPKRQRRRNLDTIEGQHFHRYIYRLMKTIHPTMTISKQAMETVESFTRDMYTRIMNTAEEILIKDKKKTLTEKDISAAMKLTLNGQLVKHAEAEAEKALLKSRQK